MSERDIVMALELVKLGHANPLYNEACSYLTKVYKDGLYDATDLLNTVSVEIMKLTCCNLQALAIEYISKRLT